MIPAARKSKIKAMADLVQAQRGPDCSQGSLSERLSNSTTHAHQVTSIYLFMHNVPDTFVKTYLLP